MKIIYLAIYLSVSLFARDVVYKNLELNRAIAVLKNENLEINTANIDNFNDYENEYIKIKLYYSNGVKEQEIKISDILRFKHEILRKNNFSFIKKLL